MQDSHFRVWSIFLGLVIFIAGSMSLLGRFEPVAQLDTAGYSDFPVDRLDNALNSQRTFVYPLILKAFQWLFGSNALLPFFQYSVSALACGAFMRTLMRCGWQPGLALGATLPMMTSLLVLDYTHLVTPDLVAQSFAILAVSSWLSILHKGGGLLHWVLLSTWMFLAYQTKPAYLFLLVFVPVGGAIARWWLFAEPRDSLVLGVKLAIASFVPFLGWCTLRWVLVGHFGLVAFGGYNIVGIAGQLLQREWVDELSADVQPLAQEILERREQRQDWKNKISYSTYESQYNPMVWEIAVPAASKLYGNDSRAMNFELSRFSKEVIATKPVSYLIWLALAANNAFKQCLELTILNPMVTLSMFAILLFHSLRWKLRKSETSAPAMEDIRSVQAYQTMVWLGIGYAMCSLALVILVETPISRYCGPAAIFLSSLPGMLAVSMFRWIHSLRANQVIHD